MKIYILFATLHEHEKDIVFGVFSDKEHAKERARTYQSEKNVDEMEFWVSERELIEPTH